MMTVLWVIGGIAAYFLLGKVAFRLSAAVGGLGDMMLKKETYKETYRVYYNINLKEVLTITSLKLFWPLTLIASLAALILIIVAKFFKFCWR